MEISNYKQNITKRSLDRLEMGNDLLDFNGKYKINMYKWIFEK